MGEIQNVPVGVQTRGVQTQEVIDERQSGRITAVERQQDANTANIAALADAVNKLTIEIKTYTGAIWIIGLLFGALISVLQVLQLMSARRNGRSR